MWETNLRTSARVQRMSFFEAQHMTSINTPALRHPPPTLEKWAQKELNAGIWYFQGNIQVSWSSSVPLKWERVELISQLGQTFTGIPKSVCSWVWCVPSWACCLYLEIKSSSPWQECRTLWEPHLYAYNWVPVGHFYRELSEDAGDSLSCVAFTTDVASPLPGFVWWQKPSWRGLGLLWWEASAVGTSITRFWRLFSLKVSIAIF